MSENNGLNDEICMAFLKSKSDLALKEGDEHRVQNSIILDKSDLAIEAIDFTLQYMMEKQN